MQRGTRLQTASAAAATSLVLASCGGGYGADDSEAGSTPDETGTEGTQVTTGLTEWTIDLSEESFSPGTYTFAAENNGETAHALAVRGPGVEGEETEILPAGDTAKLTVGLEEGTYEVWCPVPGHREQGMELTVTIGDGGGQPDESPTGDDGGYGY